MHSRGDYKERDAREIWWHVKQSLEKTIQELPELQELKSNEPNVHGLTVFVGSKKGIENEHSSNSQEGVASRYWTSFVKR